MGLRRIAVNDTFLANSLIYSGHIHANVVGGVPKDSRIVNIVYDVTRGAYEFVIMSDEWYGPNPGEYIEEISPEITTYDCTVCSCCWGVGN